MQENSKISKPSDSPRNQSTTDSYEAVYDNAIENHQKTFEYMKSNSFKLQFNQTVNEINRCLGNGGIVFTCGNGGSLCDAQHLTAELVVRFSKNRNPIASSTLGSNLAVITAYSNDYKYSQAISREIEAVAKPKDLLVAISTSGASENIVSAIETANSLRMNWILLTSEKCSIKSKHNIIIKWPYRSTASVQQAHTFFIHMLCEILEDNVIT